MRSIASEPPNSSETRSTGRRAGLHPRLRLSLRRAAALTLGVLIALLATGCHHHPQQAYAPPPPPPTSYPSRPRVAHTTPPVLAPTPHTPPRDPVPDPGGKPTLVETGLASWYGPSGRHAADGSVYDGNSMTAAHKTLPLGSVVRVTNLVNGETVMVKITDRGPFANGRVLDLSEAAAKQIDLYRMGVAKVKVEAFANPAASPTGKWCVQTGAFKAEQDALDLKAALIERYHGAKVIEFPGATGYWVRINPAQPGREQAAAIMDWIGTPDPQAVPYLLRVD
jgi:rare lipoprotein A